MWWVEVGIHQYLTFLEMFHIHLEAVLWENGFKTRGPDSGVITMPWCRRWISNLHNQYGLCTRYVGLFSFLSTDIAFSAWHVANINNSIVEMLWLAFRRSGFTAWHQGQLIHGPISQGVLGTWEYTIMQGIFHLIASSTFCSYCLAAAASMAFTGDAEGPVKRYQFFGVWKMGKAALGLLSSEMGYHSFQSVVATTAVKLGP